MNRRNVQPTIIIAFGFLLALLVGNALFANHAIEGMVDSQTVVKHSLEVRLKLLEAQSQFEKSLAEVRAYFNTSDASYLEGWKKSRQAMWQNIEELKQNTKDNSVQQDNIASLENVLKGQDAFFQGNLDLKHRDFMNKPWIFKPTNVAQSKTYVTGVAKYIEAIDIEENRLSFLREQQLAKAEQQARFTIFGATAMACLTLLSTFLLIRQILRVREASEEKVRQVNAELEQRVEDRTRSLQLANDGLKAANQELEAFSYTVSHDLRAPVRHVLGFAELLEKRSGEQLNDSGKRYLGLIKGAGQRAGALIDDLLAFSRMSRTPLDFRLIPMNEKVGKVQADMADAYPNTTIEWQVDPLPEIHGDAAMIRQVWQNLLDNAVKYSSKNDVIKIHIGARRHEDEWEFFVKDNGVGFDMEHAQNLFMVFSRLYGSDDFEGTGIGLANVRRIVARHGGRTWAEGIPDQGATFYFSLPAALPAAEAKEQG